MLEQGVPLLDALKITQKGHNEIRRTETPYRFRRVRKIAKSDY